MQRINCSINNSLLVSSATRVTRCQEQLAKLKEMYPTNILRRIPGEALPPAKAERQGYIDDLSKKEKFELEELLERQNKLLANEKFIMKLPDKGDRIRGFHEKIVQVLQRKTQVEEAAALLSRLNIASEGKAAMNQLEWTGKYAEETDRDLVKVVELGSDDDEDPLKILAQPTGTGLHKKTVIHLPAEESLIKSEDLEEIQSLEKDTALDPEHIKYLVKKSESGDKSRGEMRESYKPYKTTKSGVHDPMIEKERKLNKHWEVTAATPPLIVHGAAKTLSLNDSLKLQKEQANKLQEIRAKHAAQRLTEQLGLYGVGGLSGIVRTYRDHEKDTSSSSESDHGEYEVHDEEDNDKGGTVVFTVESVEN